MKIITPLNKLSINIMIHRNEKVFIKKQKCFTSYPTVLLDGVPLGLRGFKKNTVN
jgi:hypothetical protein